MSSEGNPENTFKQDEPGPAEGSEGENQSKARWPSRAALKTRDQLQAYREKHKDPEARKERRERWTIVGLFAAAGMALLQWNALHSTDEKIGEQIKVLNRQLNLLESGSSQTDKLIAANVQLAEAARKSAEVAERTVNTMESTATRELRAYVFVDTLNPPDLEAYPKIVMAVKNSGKTPALDVIQQFASRIDSYPIPETPLAPLAEIPAFNQGVLNAGET